MSDETWEQYAHRLMKALMPVLGEYCWEFCGSVAEDDWHDDKCKDLRAAITENPGNANPNPLGA